jgi:hypothetical protein
MEEEKEGLLVEDIPQHLGAYQPKAIKQEKINELTI